MPDNISALMGLNQNNPEEARMAQALRRQQGTGDFLGLSTLKPVASMGSRMSTRSAQGANRAGALKQARRAAAANLTESNARRDFTEGQASVLAKARKKQLDIEEAGRAARRELDNRKLNVLEAKNKATKAYNIRSNEIKTFKEDKKAENMANMFGLNVDKFSETLAENKFGRKMKKAEFDQSMAEFAATHRLDEATLVSRVNQWGVENGLSQAKIDAQIDQYGSTLGYKRDVLDARKEQWGSENQHADEALHLKEQKLAEQIQGNFADRQYKSKALAQQDSHFSQQYAADISQYAQAHDLDVDKLAADILSDRNSEQIKRDALYYKLVGKTGILDAKKRSVPKETSVLTKAEKIAKAQSDWVNLMRRYKPEYGGSAYEPEFVGDMQNYMAGKFGGMSSDAMKEQQAFWAEFGRIWELPERHEMFGGALTGTEVPKWEKTTPNVGMPADQLSAMLKNMTRRIVDHASTKARMGDLRGYSREYTLERYGWLEGVEDITEGDFLTGASAQDAPAGQDAEGDARRARIAELKARRGG